LGIDARQKAPRKTAQSVKRSNKSVAVEQLSALPVVKSSDKLYTPDEFTGEHVTELLTENAALRDKVRFVLYSVTNKYERYYGPRRECVQQL